MSGICGIINSKEEVNHETIKEMTNILYHRGPDEEGYFIEGNIGLGVRRLNIIDLKYGSQPIYNEDETIVTICDGKIYNYQELREDLKKKKHIFHTNSDTEVIIHLYEDYQEECLQYLCGMFAFCIYDKKNNKIFLSRDRVGIKPLYYTEINNNLIFASEIKAILKHPQIKKELNLEALHHYLTYLYPPDDQTFFVKINELLPAYFLIYQNNNLILRKYWDVEFNITKNKEEEIIEELDNRLNKAIKLHLVADVEVGCFLSGGIDSSIVTAIAQNNYSKRLKTFSIGFTSAGFYNELPYAKIVAQHYSTDHYEFIVKPDAINILPKIIWFFDQPFADASSIPNYYVAEEAKKYIKVVLTGLGGDELFGGYLRYAANNLFKYYQLLPKPLHYFINYFANLLPAYGRTRLTNYFRLLKKFISSYGLKDYERYIKWNTFFDEKLKQEIYNDEIRQQLKSTNSYLINKQYFEYYNDLDFISKAQYVDMKTYLPYDTLYLTDRMTSAHSLEGRVPLLDNGLINLSTTIPSEIKLKKFKTKYLLRKLGKKYLPAEILNREKHGFAIPIDLWITKELKDIIYKILVEDKNNYFKKDKIKELINIHMKGKQDFSQHIYALFIFNLWHKICFEKNYNSPPSITIYDLL